MIEIDYKLEQDRGSDIKSYGPKLFKNNKLNELSQIEADNSFGKSTFLQIMAMSFSASERNVENDELLAKINRLHKPHNKLTFNLTIDNPKFEFIVQIEKKSGKSKDLVFSKIDRKSSEVKFLTNSTVLDQFKLIYDIPNDPLSRLKELINDVSEFQTEISSKLSSLITVLDRNIDTIKNQPTEEEINELTTDIVDIEEDIKGLKNKIENKDEYLKALEKLALIRKYNSKKSKRASLDKRKSEYSKKQRDQGPKPKEIDTSERSTIVLALDKFRDSIEDQTEEIKDIINNNFINEDKIDLKKINKRFEDIDIEDINNKQPEETTTSYFLNRVERIIKDLQENSLSKSDIKILTFYRSIKETLERFKQDDLKIPQVNISANEFMEIISQEIEKLGGISEEDEKAIGKINNIISLIRRQLDENFKYYRKNKDKLTSKSSKSNYEDYSGRIEKAKQDILENEKKIKEALNGLVRYKISENNITPQLNKITNKFPDLSRLTDEIQILNKQPKVKEEKGKLENSLSKRKKALVMLNNDLVVKKESLKNKNKFSKNIEVLEKHVEAAYNLSIKLQDLNNIITKLKKEEEVPNDTFTNDSLEVINSILAKKMQSVRHEDKDHDLKRLNYKDQFFLTTDNMKLYFEDFGTGQSQVNYLKSKLERKYDKPMVVLLDETGNMAPSTIELLHSIIKKLYTEGKILAGILVQPGSEPIVTKIN